MRKNSHTLPLINYRLKCFTALLLLVFSYQPWPVLAVDDAYLKALEVEARKSASVTNNKSKPNNSPADVLKKKHIPAESFKNFELNLRSSRPATYRFYKKLNLEDKTQVYAIYTEDHKMSRASKKVFDIYFEKNK